MVEKKGSAMATLSPIMTPLPGARLYKLTAIHFEFLSVRQKVLKIIRKGVLIDVIHKEPLLQKIIVICGILHVKKLFRLRQVNFFNKFYAKVKVAPSFIKISR